MVRQDSILLFTILSLVGKTPLFLMGSDEYASYLNVWGRSPAPSVSMARGELPSFRQWLYGPVPNLHQNCPRKPSLLSHYT